MESTHVLWNPQKFSWKLEKFCGFHRIDFGIHNTCVHSTKCFCGIHTCISIIVWNPQKFSWKLEKFCGFHRIDFGIHNTCVHSTKCFCGIHTCISIIVWNPQKSMVKHYILNSTESPQFEEMTTLAW